MRGFSMSNLRSVRTQTVQHLRSVGVCLALVCGLSAPAWADLAPLPDARRTAEAPSPAPAASAVAQPDKDGFVPESRPMNGPTVDASIPAGPLVATAYGFVWIAVLGYIVHLGRGIRRVEGDLAELEGKLSKSLSKS